MRFALSACVGVACGFGLYAQVDTQTVEGRVLIDCTKAAVGARVTAKESRLKLEFSTHTAKPDGLFRFLDLDQGKYELVSEFKDFRPQGKVVVKVEGGNNLLTLDEPICLMTPPQLPLPDPKPAADSDEPERDPQSPDTITGTVKAQDKAVSRARVVLFRTGNITLERVGFAFTGPDGKFSMPIAQTTMADLHASQLLFVVSHSGYVPAFENLEKQESLPDQFRLRLDEETARIETGDAAHRLQF